MYDSVALQECGNVPHGGLLKLKTKEEQRAEISRCMTRGGAEEVGGEVSICVEVVPVAAFAESSVRAKWGSA